MWFTFAMAKVQTRRNFLQAAPLAAAVSLALPDRLLFASTTPVDGIQSTAPATPVPFQVFTASALADDAKALVAKPGNNTLFDSKAVPLAIVLTTEVGKSAKEFEWHEGRDHIVQIVAGSTLYEVGGTPKNPRNTRAGEWLAPASEGSSSFKLSKGDMLLIPRGTPHMRSTEGSVTFILISSSGAVQA